MKKIAIILASFLLFSCGSDDTAEIIETPQQNGFNYDGSFYQIKTVYINDENTSDSNPSDIGFSFVNKTNAEISGSTDLTQMATINFDYTAVNVQQGTFTNVGDYNGSINKNRVSGVTSAGTPILDDNVISLQASNISFTINNITSTTVDISFSFTRTDGEIISGHYNGNYLIP
ncbi:hypothetical protein [Flavobacterium terrigena]|uniref:Lipid-binding hydrolase n=1 Tax=Flavobacterium terrigena TaxID=402734 RepID=A0A1H6TNZ0_9FLAO|nr:hypothetical protein [Flavobacterium terrigena]SEI77945.1 hypothetical protein SAMN05660918_1598 [Flavobacterium terrigena]